VLDAPCVQTCAVTAADDDHLVLTTGPRVAGGADGATIQVRTSADAGRTWSGTHIAAYFAIERMTSAASRDVIGILTSGRRGGSGRDRDRLLVSRDGGRTFTERLSDDYDRLRWFGFQTPDVGHVIRADGVVSETRDAGRTWGVVR
jgi:photosystem II stability/assembly factor-like uncharacterized protein